MILLGTKAPSSLATSTDTDLQYVSPDAIARMAGRRVVIDLVTPETPKNQGIDVKTPPTIIHTPPRQVYMDKAIWYHANGDSVDMAELTDDSPCHTQPYVSPNSHPIFKEKSLKTTRNDLPPPSPPRKKKKTHRKISSLEESSSD